KPYSEKPILFYWAVAATTPLSGGDVSPTFSRLPSALGGALLVFGAAWLAGLSGSRREELLAGAMTATAPIVVWQSQFLQIDALFSGLVLGSLLALHRRKTYLFYVLLALAVLAKGPLA